MADEPTLGEALRLLDAVSRRLERLAEDMARDRREVGQTYVRRELYLTERDDDRRRVKDLEDGNKLRDENEDAKRRQYTFIALTVGLTSIAGLLVSLVNLIAGSALGG